MGPVLCRVSFLAVMYYRKGLYTFISVCFSYVLYAVNETFCPGNIPGPQWKSCNIKTLKLMIIFPFCSCRNILSRIHIPGSKFQIWIEITRSYQSKQCHQFIPHWIHSTNLRLFVMSNYKCFASEALILQKQSFHYLMFTVFTRLVRQCGSFYT